MWLLIILLLVLFLAGGGYGIAAGISWLLWLCVILLVLSLLFGAFRFRGPYPY